MINIKISVIPIKMQIFAKKPLWLIDIKIAIGKKGVILLEYQQNKVSLIIFHYQGCILK